MPRFFTFDHDTFAKRSYPWAHSFRASVRTRKCSTCGLVRSYAHGPAEISMYDKGSKWLDIIGIDTAGPAEPMFMVSQQVIDAMVKNKCRGVKSYPITIKENWSKSLRAKEGPQYFYLDVTGKVDVDLALTGIEYENRCTECFGGKQKVRLKSPERLVPLPESWDGSELFMIRNLINLSLFCTERIIELAHEHKWTNFKFVPMELTREETLFWPGVDYLGKKWPPVWSPT